MDDKKTFFILILIISVSMPFAKADTKIYKYVDQNGQTIFSNKRIKDATQVETTPNSTKFTAKSIQSSNSFPEVSNHTQTKRDIKRRQILEHELDTEHKLLENAKQMLHQTIQTSHVTNQNEAQSERDILKLQNKLKIIQRQVSLHEKNIAALKKELSRP